MSYKRIKLTKHASKRMELRNITFDEIKSTLTSPDRIYKDIKSNANVYIKNIRQYSIVVIASEEKTFYKVITVYKARNINKLLKSKVNRGIWI